MVSLISTVKNTDRLRQILTVLAKHGFGELLSRAPDIRALLPGRKAAAPAAADAGAEPSFRRTSFAPRLRTALQELGPSFVKLGQIVSTRPDLVPEDIVVELKKLQDDVPPMKPEQVTAALTETFGGQQSELFVSVDDEPLASASIGQVHAARLRTADGGEVDVVIKIQRAGIARTIARDLDLLYLLARLIERHVPESKIYAPTALVAEFDRAITAELDFAVEADNADKFARNFAGDERVRFPAIYREASGKRVLTMERFAGDKIYAFVDQGGSREAVAKNALHAIAQMIFEHGFFHADPHPGNIIILGTLAAPVLGLIDLGLVGRLSPQMRDKAVALMVAAVRNDADALADALLAMGRPRKRVDLDAFRAEVGELSDKYLGKPLAQVEMSAMIRDLVQGAIRYEIEMPVEMMMVGKALMTVEGIGKEVYPELDVWTELRPYLLRLLWNRYSPERIARDVFRGVSQLGAAATTMPGQVRDILADLRNGQLEVRARDPGLPVAADRLGRRVFSGLVVAGATAGGVGALAIEHDGLGYVLLAIAAAQLVFHLWGDLRRRRPS